MQLLRTGAITLAFVAIVLIPSANAQAATVDEMLTKIQALMTQIESLQKQLATIRGEVKAVIKEGLQEGMTDEDIKKIQEILATDSTIYPEGKVTGYFGPLTKEAVKRFQARHELTVTGVIDAETSDLLEEYLHEGFGDRIPPGLLKAPGIAKKVELRYELKCESQKGMGPLCKKLKAKYGNDDDGSDDDDDSSDDTFHVEVEIEDGTTTVSFKYRGTGHEVEVTSTDLDDILDAVADELNKDVADLNDDLVSEIEDALDDASDDSSDEDFEVEVEIENGSTTLSFTFDGEDYDVEVASTDEDDVLDAAADAIDSGDDASDLDDDLRNAIEEALEDALDDAEDTEAREEAEDAIDDAEDAIDDAQDAIDAASGDTEAAEDLLEDAVEKLAAAEDAFDDEDYDEAADLADDAKDLAEDAEDAV